MRGGVHFLNEGSTHSIVTGDLIDEGGVPADGHSILTPLSIMGYVLPVLGERLTVLRVKMIFYLTVSV